MEDLQNHRRVMEEKHTKHNNDIDKVVAVIPAFNPDNRLPSYVSELRESGFDTIVVVDDGSEDSCKSIFNDLEGKAHVLHHELNKGKGAALKTGLEWIRSNVQDAKGVITLDSDGQHSVKDSVRIAQMLDDKSRLILGARDFNLPNIPFKSRAGNKITSLVFKLLYGQYLTDTQTGLRAFPMQLIDFMSSIEGERYEYEMNVLIECAKAKVPMESVAIETIYEDNNEGSHFRPFADSFRIYKLIFGKFIKFTGISIISMLVDQGLFNFMNLIVFANGKTKIASYILASTAIARVLSASLNFTLNRKLVFKADNRLSKAALRYILTCAVVMLLSALGTWTFSKVGLNTTIAKIIVDGALYILSYKAQDNWVFKKGYGKEN